MSRRHLEEYNQQGVWCWWRWNWCRPFENHNSSSISMENEKKYFKSRGVVPIYDSSVFTRHLCLHLHQEFVSLPSIISFFMSEVLSSSTSNAVTAGNSFLFFTFWKRSWKWVFFLKWKWDLGSILVTMSDKEKVRSFLVLRIPRRKIVFKLDGFLTEKPRIILFLFFWSFMEM